ncbi:MAG: PRD domain-containing protein [Thomasclavelia sp.]|nr:PRD domain-containing protein [Thomasclavelia sp.]
MTNKEIVYETLLDYHDDYESTQSGLTTTFLSSKLNMQRSNVSAILNQLVKEGKVIKGKGRPVEYFISSNSLNQRSNQSFSSLIGYDKSLNNVLKVIQAAVLYPDSKPLIYMVGESGCGYNTLANLTKDFAIQNNILKKGAEVIVLDISYYQEGELNKQLLTDNYIKKAENGLLLIKNANLLSKQTLLRLINYISNTPYKEIVMIQSSENNLDDNGVINNIVYVPNLPDRGLQERFELICKFFKEEAIKINLKIEVNYGIMQSLLLFPTKGNLRELQGVIKTGIANAYAKDKESKTIVLEIGDLSPIVRKGLLFVSDNIGSLKEVLENNQNYIFDKDTVYHNKIKKDEDIYSYINHNKITSINHISNELQTQINDYLHNISNNINDDILRKTVPSKLITLVDNYLNDLSSKLKVVYPKDVTHGLCIHLNNIINNKSHRLRFNNDFILDMIENYNDEYIQTRKFIRSIENEFDVHISGEETVFILLTTILPYQQVNVNKVVTLVVTHGKTTASSIVDTAKNLLGTNNIYSFDLKIEDDIDESYNNLKQKVININQGKGIIVIYDMGSIRVMMDSIREETSIDIRVFEMPITLLAMSASKIADDGSNIDTVYNHLLVEYSDVSYKRQKSDKTVIVLSDNENDLNEMYKQIQSINDNYNLEKVLGASKEDVISKINSLPKNGKIVGVIGTYDPEIFDVEYINYDDIDFNKTLNNILKEQEFDILSYLGDQFSTFNKEDAALTIVPLVNRLEKVFKKKFDEDNKIGIYIHIGCLIDGLLKKQTPTVNFNATSIINNYPEYMSKVKKTIRPLEQYYDIEISDGDIATLISIML